VHRDGELDGLLRQRQVPQEGHVRHVLVHGIDPSVH
jgi:hypothetical protein